MKLLDMGVKTGMLPDFAENYVNQSFARNYKDKDNNIYKAIYGTISFKISSFSP